MTNLHLTSFTLMGGLALIFSAACVPNMPWRTSPEITDPSGKHQSSLITGANGEETLIVEFDDQGETFGDAERHFALDRIEDWSSQDASKPLTLLVFIHGWHHNASPKDENLRSFLRTIADLSNTYPERKVAGLYLGWRGEATRTPILKYLTFWNRRNAAVRVGGIPTSHLLSEIAVKVQRSPQNFFVVIGHSFGARVLETAITNSVAALCAEDPGLIESGPSSGPNQPLPIPDLVILLNEASEALRTKASIDAFKDSLTAPISDLTPRIVSITSSADTATGFAFPLGQWFPARKLKFQDYRATGTLAEKKLGLSQSKLFQHTAGHLPQLWSHEVREAKPELLNISGATIFRSNNESDVPGDSLIIPLSQVYNEGTPYWVFQVSHEVMADHNDIFNPKVRGLLTGIVNRWFFDVPASKATPITQSLQRGNRIATPK